LLARFGIKVFGADLPQPKPCAGDPIHAEHPTESIGLEGQRLLRNLIGELLGRVSVFPWRRELDLIDEFPHPARPRRVTDGLDVKEDA